MMDYWMQFDGQKVLHFYLFRIQSKCAKSDRVFILYTYYMYKTSVPAHMCESMS